MKQLAICLVALSLLVIGGCTMPTSGLFYTLENEAAINNATNGLPVDALTGAKDSRTDKLVSIGGNYLVIAGTTLYVNTIPATNTSGVVTPISTKWTTISVPDPTLPACTDLAVGGSNLYALFASNANYVDGVTTSASKAPELYIGTGTPSSPSWKKLTVPLSETPQGLFTNSSGTAILQTAISGTASLYYLYLLSGETLTKVAGFAANHRPVTAVAGPDASTMIVTGDTVYSGNLTGSPSLTARTAPTSVTLPNFSALAWEGGSTYYLASQTGWLGKSTDDGLTWPVFISESTSKFNSLVYLSPFNDFSGGTPLTDLLIAGSAGQGLWRINTTDLKVAGSDMTTDLLWSGDYTSAKQSLASTRGLFKVAGSKVFIGTNNRGLWSFVYNSQSATTPVKSGLFFTWE